MFYTRYGRSADSHSGLIEIERIESALHKIISVNSLCPRSIINNTPHAKYCAFNAGTMGVMVASTFRLCDLHTNRIRSLNKTHTKSYFNARARAVRQKKKTIDSRTAFFLGFYGSLVSSSGVIRSCVYASYRRTHATRTHGDLTSAIKKKAQRTHSGYTPCVR